MAKAVEMASVKYLMVNNGIALCPSHNEAMLYGAFKEGNLVLYLADDHRQ
jgi:predicted restriction endonuclease